MKRISISALFIYGLLLSIHAQDYWEQLDSVNGPSKATCVSFEIQGEGFILGGLDDFGFKRKMYSYDQFQDDWDDEESIGGPNGDGLERGSSSGFSIGNKGYICLGQGQTNPFFKDLWEFNWETNAWSQKADFEGSPRKQAISFVIDNIAYVGTGQDASGLTKDFYKYDPATNNWTQLNDFPGTARRQAVGFSMGSNGFVGTGDDGVVKNDFWMYVPVTDTWIQKANFPGTPRAGATGWGVFPTAFIATGEDINFEYKKDVWEYNYFGNSWVQRADLPGPGRKNATSFVINGIAFLGTGYNGVFQDDFYAYHRIVGLKENQMNFYSNVFPNPAIDLVTVTVGEETTQDLELRIYSVTGSEVTNLIGITKSSSSFQLNTSMLLSGNYLYILTNKSSERSSTGKLIIL